MTYQELINLVDSQEVTLFTSDNIPLTGKFCNGRMKTVSGSKTEITFEGQVPRTNISKLPEVEFQLTGDINGNKIEISVFWGKSIVSFHDENARFELVVSKP